MTETTERMRQFFGPKLTEYGLASDGAYETKGMAFRPTIDMENRLVRGLVSTESQDLDGEVVLQNGFDFSFFDKRVQSVYLDHIYTSGPGSDRVAPVAVCRNLKQTREGLLALTYIRDTTLGDDILSAMQDGALGGFSIGFKAHDVGPATDEEQDRLKVGAGTTVIRQSQLLEYSLTAMPANPDALAKGGGVSEDLAKCIRDKRLRELGHALRPQRPQGRHVVIGESVTAMRAR